jgi:hypothetical protein
MDHRLVNIEAFSSGNRVGVVGDLLLSCSGPRIAGFVLDRGLFRKVRVRSELMKLDKAYRCDPSFEEDNWKPGKAEVVGYRSTWEGEAICTDHWRIGKLRGFDVDIRTWDIVELYIDVVHSLLLGDVNYDKIEEVDGGTSETEIITTVGGTRSGASRKTIFLTASGDRGAATWGRIQAGERISRVTLPTEGTMFRPGGTIRLPMKGRDLESITLELINSGMMERGSGRREIVRNVFGEYLRRSGEPDDESGDSQRW